MRQNEGTAIPRRTKTGRKVSPPPPETLLEIAKRSLDADKAQNTVVIDLAGKTNLADHMIIASGTSARQVAAMAEHLRERLKAGGLTTVPAEGIEHCDWVLIDAGDVIVHLFRPEVRNFYNLEKMWGTDFPDADSATGWLVG
jgi:ribosome-associated protein